MDQLACALVSPSAASEGTPQFACPLSKNKKPT
jgi:hypothetical protein